ncbi:CshA/CshB family fibrillar adhesin-related protein [Glycomyces dulcitolivorans]|uniref:CshA/CshB family fibrillar adhesin-related protein n=1 Tax=Glycomyces dulcitolivorans TaxID=2200759 RepID=UPI0038CC16B3
MSAAALAAAATVLAASPAQAQVSGCSYGSGGEYDSTICWIDMSGFDQTQAMSAAGQPMSIELTDDYSMSFTFKFTAGDDGYRILKPVAFPTYRLAPIGNTAYTGTTGQPALYQQVNAGTGAAGDLGTLAIDDLVVTGPSGTAVSGFGVVMADAESTNRQEGLTFASDKPIEQLTTATMPDALPACGQELSGLGTTSVTCRGNTAGGLAVGEIVLYADSPSTASIGFLDRTANAVQGVAFGILTAKVGLTKAVEDKTADTDSFGISITDDDGNAIGEASTAGGDSATVDPTTVLAALDGRDFTFAETAEAGTDLSTYTQSWNCTNNGETDDDLPSGEGTEQTVAVDVGDDIECTVVNTGTPPVDPTDGPSSPGATASPAAGSALPETGTPVYIRVLVAAVVVALGAAGVLIARRVRSTW